MVTALAALGAGLLVLSGAAKVPTPDGAMTALHQLGLPSGRIAARLLGLGEVAVGVFVILAGGVPGAVALLATYSALFVVAAVQRRRKLDCGCFGAEGSQVSRLHLALDALFAATGLAGIWAEPWTPAAVGADAGTIGLLASTVLLITGVGLLRTALAGVR